MKTAGIKKILLYVLLYLSAAGGIEAQAGLSGGHGPLSFSGNIPDTKASDKRNDVSKVKWTKNPFDHQLFIENKGQFDTDLHTPDKILYQARLGDVRGYFTPTGVVYKLEKFSKNEGEDEDNIHEIDPEKEISYASYTWQGCNPNAAIEAKEEQSYTYAYPTGKASSVKVNVFKKIVYHNLYPGIDCEYSFIKEKPGLKYALIVHPGADLSKVKLKYNDVSGLSLKPSGDISVQSDIGEITDHAPISYFQKTGKKIKSNYQITSGNEESFSVNATADSTDNIVIDPWSWNPNFTAAYDAAYDVDYDNAGNVYAYGSYNPFQLTKFNAAGVQQWTFNATTLLTNYGDFAVDKVTGTSYITEGADNASGAKVLKVNTVNTLVATFPGTTNMYEMWRAEYNACTHQILIGGGGANNPYSQSCILDTDMTTFTPVNSLNAVNFKHDVCLIAMDPTGNTAFMAIAQTPGTPTTFNNVLVSLPIPALTPYNYLVNDNYKFLEVGSVAYFQGASPPNGMNGMAASPNYLYMYDGDTLKKVNKGNGAIIGTKQVSNLGSFQFGGLDADACDNAFVGDANAIKVYSSAFALVTTIPLKAVVYDVVLGANDKIVYTAENGFVEAIDLNLPPTVTITNTKTQATCGKCNGTAKATLLLCGSAPTLTPTYAWSPGGQTTQSVTNLCAGTYSVTINLGCGQVYLDTVTITSTVPPPLVLTPSQTNVKCFGGSTGTASVSVSGGTPGYTYTWVPAGGTNATASNLPVGTYTVRVVDAGCEKDSSIFTITSPAQLRDSMASITNVKCFGGTTGTATVGVKGGATPYSYSWNSSPTQSTVKATGLPIGTYTVIVTDANGCTVKTDTTITQPSQLRDSIVSTTPVTCPGSTNGTATVGVKDGTPGYTYSWTPGGQITPTATNLSAGTYTCTITDANGCAGPTAVATITSLSSMRDSIVTAATVNELCFGSASGSLTVAVKGGTPGYTYAWVPGGKTTPTINGLTAGSYTVTVTDANTCTVTATGTITQPTKVRDSISTSNNVLCFGGSTGAATVGVKDGTPGYTYSWNTTPPQTTATATGLPIGSYNCTVTDANGCLSVVNVIIVQPKPLTVQAAAFPTKCNGSCDGSATALPKGGTTPYGYAWNPGGQTTPNIINLCAGNYSVQVTDANGCVVDSTPVTVTSPPGMVITKTATVSAHCGQADGSGGISVNGGSPPYKYVWSNSGSGTNAMLTNVVSGSYCVTVTDANACTDTACIVIANVPGETVTITSSTNDTCHGGADGTVAASVTGNVGPFTYLWKPGGQSTPKATGLPAGIYTITIVDSVGCVAKAVDTITQPAAVNTTTNVLPPICIGQSTTIDASSTGGTAPYKYVWSTGTTGSTITVSPIVTTTYTVNTTDAYGCLGNPDSNVVVTVDLPLSLKTISPVAICPGGTATLNAIGSGGNGTYTYVWQPGSDSGSSIKVTPLFNSVYTVTLTDNCGTLAVTDSVQVLIDPLPIVKFTSDTLEGCPKQCIKFTDQSTVAGGIKSWLWTFGNSKSDTSTTESPTYCFDSSGVYNVSLAVTSDSGCTSSLTKPNLITIFSSPMAAFTLSPQQTSTINPLITFTDSSTDAYGITGYLWEFNEPPYDATADVKDTSYAYHDSGTYCPELFVVNKHGCKDSVEHCLVISPYFTFYIPNAFSPNADGKNDVFLPKATFVCKYQMYIFDRWGMQLFYTEDINQGWDGTVNGGGVVVQEDTYIYVINLVDCVQYQKHSYLGRVTVIK
ncbi:MAG TPA: gliding motility-associated C-terminal domain-containing protein [Bacteroidia bacterium]|nr:gliding motility-associated C-terminal domain-containing protein [Bacteroidia bacterium]